MLCIISGNAQYIKYLTPMRALWFFLNAPFRARRFFDSDGASAYCSILSIVILKR